MIEPCGFRRASKFRAGCDTYGIFGVAQSLDSCVVFSVLGLS